MTSSAVINSKNKVRVFAMVALTALVLVATAVLILTAGKLTHAATNDSVPTAAVSITITPAKSVLELTPGARYDGSFSVINTGANAFDFNLSVKPYSITNDSYDYSLTEETSYTYVSRWVSFDQTVYHLKSDETIKVLYHVDVPENAPAGGSYAVILAQTESAQTDHSAIDSSQEVGMLIFARVQGNIRQQGRIVSQEIRRFYLSLPLSATARLENTGNLDFNVTNKFTVQTLLGKTVYTKTRQDTILPKTYRDTEITWDQTPAIGIFKATQEMSFLGKTTSVSKIVVVVPIWLIILSLLIIAAVVFVHIMSVRRKRRIGFGLKNRGKR